MMVVGFDRLFSCPDEQVGRCANTTRRDVRAAVGGGGGYDVCQLSSIIAMRVGDDDDGNRYLSIPRKKGGLDESEVGKT